MLDIENTAPSPKGNDNMSDEEDNIFNTGKKKSMTNRLPDSDDEDNITNSTHLEKPDGNNFDNDNKSANSTSENVEKDRNSEIQPIAQSDSNSSDEEKNIFFTRKKKANMSIMEDSDDENLASRENNNIGIGSGEKILSYDEDSNSSASKTVNKKSLTKRSVIRPQTDDSESDLSDDVDISKSGRIQDRRKKLTDKFKSMLSKKKFYTDKDENKESETMVEDAVKPKSTIDNLYDSEESDYDAETSNQADAEILSKKRNNHVKSSPKVQRMSAKQAMENMQMIKSESNRMLREKQISLPYHKPRQITLKEIMEKRRPILGPGGKQLRVKMNEEQLREYALQLEERQKQVIELYKSESEDETEADNEDNESSTKNELNNQSEESEEKSTKAEEKTETNDNTDIESVIVKIVNPENEDVVSNNLDLGNIIENKLDSCNENQTDVPQEVEELTIKTNENNTNLESQLITLNYNSELTEQALDEGIQKDSKSHDVPNEEDDAPNQDKADIDNYINHQEGPKENTDAAMEDDFDDHFSDVDMSHVEEVIRRIEDNDNDYNKENENHQVPKIYSEDVKPKLSGAPGTIINLDFDDPEPGPRKLTGVDRLKERFMYFSKIKTLEELEREKEKRITPGFLHLKLKQELEEQMAKQRTEEWAKRLEEERIRQEEMKAINGDESETEDILDEIEKEEVNELEEEDSSEEDEDEAELEENDVDMSEKPKKKNPLLDEEAEEVDEEEEVEAGGDDIINEEENESESSESEEENKEDFSKTEGKKKPSRILKAFIDSSDDEDESEKKVEIVVKELAENSLQNVKENECLQKSVLSDDMFATQELKENTEFDNEEDIPLAQQNTSISEDTQNLSASEVENVTQELASKTDNLPCSGQSETPDVCAILRMDSGGQPNMEDIIGMCSGKFTSQPDSQCNPAASEVSMKNLVADGTATQCIDEDVLALCTGRFVEGIIANDTSGEEIKEPTAAQEILQTNTDTPSLKDSIRDTSLRGLLGLDEEQKSGLTQSRYFPGPEVKGNGTNASSGQNNGKLVILSSDDECEAGESKTKRKKLKSKRDRLKRTILMSDDEDSDGVKSDVETEEEEFFQEVEYDSEENEVVATHPEATKLHKKKKLKGSEFFENEAELTSEDEWHGSGDEDEKGLDELEWEEGDADKLDQKKVQRELERIHLNQMLDQDKREVRLLQEILLDEDEPGGTRQRKFKWKNADWGTEELGTVPEEGADADDEVETEEQWRKQRHERDVFLRQMMEKKKEEGVLDVSFCRTSIIKANLESKTMSSMLLEVKAAKLNTSSEELQSATVEKKASSKDLPSPVKKPFAFIQQHSIRGSFLSRGKSSLERLAALAKPIAGAQDEETQPANLNLLAPGKKRSFVFATVSPPCLSREVEEESKLAKRKANAEVATPHLIKKMRIADGGKSRFKKSLLDHIDQ